MANPDKPVICIVHGAWHRPLHYRPLINALRSAGHTVLCPPLATTGYDDSIVDKTHSDDVARVHGVLLPELDKGRTAILVGHSYGGIPTNMACEGQTVAEREKKGLKGGIVGVAYIACLPCVKPDVSILEAFGGDWLSLDIHERPVAGRLPLKTIENSKSLFYNDVEEARRSEAAAVLADMAAKPFLDAVPYVGQMVQVPKTYFVCLQDKAVPPQVQRIPAEVWGCKVVELDTGHSPFLIDSALGKLVEVIGKADQK